MKKDFIRLMLAGVAVMLPLSSYAQSGVVVEPKEVVAEKDEDRTDFIRVDEDKKNVRLQTSVTRYVKDGVNVDLIGAVHIADEQYYKDLNTLFTKSDTLLFEMVGGDQMEKGKKLEEGEQKDAQFSFLGAVYNTMQKKLELAGQKDHIDYSMENFVHADLSMAEFQKLQKEKKESLLSFAVKNAQAAKKVQKEGGKKVKPPNSFQLLKALVTGNANLLKLNIIHTLGGGDDQIAAFAGQSVIIGDRNIKCLDVMSEQIKEGNKNIGIFYGAAHFPDMEDRMLKMGFEKTEQTWMTAWDVEKE